MLSSSTSSAGAAVTASATGVASAATGSAVSVAAASSTMAIASSTASAASSAATSVSSAVEAPALAWVDSLISSHSVMPLMSSLQPVSRAAKRVFWPSLPMASESCRSGTTTMAVCSCSKSSTWTGSDGLRALAIKVLGSSSHDTMSIFSP